MRTEERKSLVDMANRRRALVHVACGLPLLIAVHQIPPITLFGFLPLSRVFFIANALACFLLIFGIAGLVAPSVFLNLASRRSSEPVLSYKTIPILAVSFFAIVFTMASFLIYAFRA